MGDVGGAKESHHDRHEVPDRRSHLSPCLKETLNTLTLMLHG
jgi:hypothetical protein